MSYRFIYRLFAFLIFLSLAGGAARAAQTTIMDEKDVLPYLERMISWRRTAVTLDTSPEIPRELVLKATLQQHSAQALNASFDFARAITGILPSPPKTPAAADDTQDKGDEASHLNRAISREQDEIDQLISGLKTEQAGKRRAALAGELKLAQEHLTLLKAVAETIGVRNVESDSLPRKIDQLAGTVAEVEGQPGSTTSTPVVTSMPNAGGGPSSGIVGLASKIYFFEQARSTVKALQNDTASLAADNTARVQVIRETVQNIMQQGRDMANPPSNNKDGAKPADKKSETKSVTAAVQAVAAAVQSATSTAKPAAPVIPVTYDDLVTQMKNLSKVATSLSQTNKALKLCTEDLSDWSNLISVRVKALEGILIFRLCMLALAIVVAFGLSALASKATRRYVHDVRRREQIRVIRKIALTVIILFILFLGFFTDLNSLATFAGLVTAGVAFAMKDMILSVIAYFQFFSSSDIRTGDTITIAGVTGRITSIGMLRFYMMELERSDTGYLPTGRVVGFANNILFQPLPFFRQTPGTNFVWNEINVSLSPDIDHAVAYKKLNDILKEIYANHQGIIRTSEEALQKFAPFKLGVSEPQTHFKFTNLGVVFVIRYAVERDMAQTLHLQITNELIAAARKDPDLKIQHVS
jgi:small-conductance mechanosensitive channel